MNTPMPEESRAVQALKEKMKQKAVEKAQKKLRESAFKATKFLVKLLLKLIINPLFWIVIGVILFILMFSILFGTKNTDNKAGKVTNEVSSDRNAFTDAYFGTLSGMFYQKYSDMSYYAQITLPEADTDTESSGKSFKEIAGFDKETVNPTSLYQGGSMVFVNNPIIKDINNKELQYTLNSGTVGMLDETLNPDIKNPEQIIKPVATSCGVDWQAKLGTMECKDEKGNPKKCTIADCLIAKEDTQELYLSEVESQNYTYTSGENVFNLSKDNSNDGQSVLKGNGTTKGQWDYGLGSLIHYQGYYEPSKITKYKVDEMVVWDEENKALKTVKFNELSDSEKTDYITKYTPYDFYIPKSEIRFDEWENALKNSNFDNIGANIKKFLSSLLPLSKNQNNGGENKLYLDNIYKSGDAKDWWRYEPGISTGIPETEIKFAIPEAVTFAGNITNTVNHAWVDVADAENIQYFTYAKLYKNTVSDSGTVNACGGMENADGLVNCQSYKVILKDGLNKTVDTISYEGATIDIDIEGDSANKALGSPRDAIAIWHEAEPDRWEARNASYNDADGINRSCSDPDAKGRDINGECGWTLVKGKPAHYKFNNHEYLCEAGEDEANKCGYTFGELYIMTLKAHKKGKLTTKKVFYGNEFPDTKKMVGAKYLQEYLGNYIGVQSYLVDKAPYNCYNIENVAPLTTLSNQGEIDRYKNAVISGNTTGNACVLETTNGNVAMFRSDYGQQLNGQMDKFNFDLMPLGHRNYLLSKLNFKFDDKLNKVANIDYELSDAIDKIGSSEDNKFASVVSNYGEALVRYGSMYGVDPTLLAMIMAQESDLSNIETNGLHNGKYGNFNLYNIELNGDRTFKAYNFGLRATASNSANSNTLPPLFSKLSGKGLNEFSGWQDLSSNADINDLSTGSMETFTVNANMFANGIKDDIRGDISGAELSIKVSAMYLQNLMEKFDYNIPMVIQAFNFGEEGMNSVLKVYMENNNLSATTKDELSGILDDDKDLAWANYTKEISTNPNRYFTWSGGTYGDYKYLSNVLRYLPNNGLKYSYTPTSDKHSTHSFGYWTIHGLRNSEEDKLTLSSKAINSSLLTAYRTTMKNGNYEDIFKLITMGRKTYKDAEFDLSSADTYRSKYQSNAYISKPELAPENIQHLISRMLTFGTDESYLELGNENEDVLNAQIASLFGGSSKKGKWISGLSTAEFIGDDPKSTPEDTYPYLLHPFMVAKNRITVPYGFYINKENERTEYNKFVEVQSVHNKETPIYASFDGTVTKVIDYQGSTSVTVEWKTPKDRLMTITYAGLKSVNVFDGDTVERGQEIGKTLDDGKIRIIFTLDGLDADFMSILNAPVKRLEIDGEEETTTGDLGTIFSNFSSFSMSEPTNSGEFGANGMISGTNVALGSELWQFKQVFGSSATININRGTHGTDDAIDFDTNKELGAGPIFAPSAGQVVSYVQNHTDVGGQSWAYNNYVWYLMKNGNDEPIALKFVHIKQNSVNTGATNFGDIIAYEGNSGASYGNHVHTAVLKFGPNYSWEKAYSDLASNGYPFWGKKCNGSNYPCYSSTINHFE